MRCLQEKSTNGCAWVSWALANCLGVCLYYLQLFETLRRQNVSGSAELAIYYKLYCK
jgi:hypothetical protein